MLVWSFILIILISAEDLADFIVSVCDTEVLVHYGVVYYIISKYVNKYLPALNFGGNESIYLGMFI